MNQVYSETHKYYSIISKRIKGLEKTFRYSLVVTGALFIVLSIIVYSGLHLIIKNKRLFEQTINYNNGVLREKIKVVGNKNDTLVITIEDYLKMKKDMYYSKFAELICEHYDERGIKVNFTIIKKIRKAIDKLENKLIKEFNYIDLLTIAKIESDFDPMAIGKAGEVGVFQILDWKKIARKMDIHSKKMFDPTINIEAGIYVLNKKYDQYKNYKKAIIAYNGLKVDEEGNLWEGYWNKFQIAKKEVIKIDRAAKNFVYDKQFLKIR